MCLLRGCPTPVQDPTEARELLMDAALAGDTIALLILAGLALPPSSRHSWMRLENAWGATTDSRVDSQRQSLGRASRYSNDFVTTGRCPRRRAFRRTCASWSDEGALN